MDFLAERGTWRQGHCSIANRGRSAISITQAPAIWNHLRKCHGFRTKSESRPMREVPPSRCFPAALFGIYLRLKDFRSCTFPIGHSRDVVPFSLVRLAISVPRHRNGVRRASVTRQGTGIIGTGRCGRPVADLQLDPNALNRSANCDFPRTMLPMPIAWLPGCHPSSVKGLGSVPGCCLRAIMVPMPDRPHGIPGPASSREPRDATHTV